MPDKWTTVNTGRREAYEDQAIKSRVPVLQRNRGAGAAGGIREPDAGISGSVYAGAIVPI
jgi:hypothetical protein